MAIAKTFLETRSVTNPEGAQSSVDAWRGDRSEDSASVELTFVAGTAAATVQTQLENWFIVNNPLPVTPAVATTDYIPLYAARDKVGDGFSLLDADGKTLVKFVRDGSGGMTIKGYDSDGNSVHYSRQQVVVIQFRGTKTATVTWPIAFKKPPVISLTLTDSSATVPYKYSVSTTGAVIRLQNAYTGQIEVKANERA